MRLSGELFERVVQGGVEVVKLLVITVIAFFLGFCIGHSYLARDMKKVFGQLPKVLHAEMESGATFEETILMIEEMMSELGWIE